MSAVGEYAIIIRKTRKGGLFSGRLVDGDSKELYRTLLKENSQQCLTEIESWMGRDKS